jgi:hypothetical protein
VFFRSSCRVLGGVKIGVEAYPRINDVAPLEALRLRGRARVKRGRKRPKFLPYAR